jgi:mono/diheme cytochrome c family protein
VIGDPPQSLLQNETPFLCFYFLFLNFYTYGIFILMGLLPTQNKNRACRCILVRNVCSGESTGRCKRLDDGKLYSEILSMNIVCSAALGLLFLGLSIAVTFLMYYLWGFPFDKTTRKSAAPKSLMRVHRVLGYAYAGIYVIMMLQMVPRMWQYQVEFPPRTVAHLILGFLIGIILCVKISIMRFFRHLEEWMPYLGTAMLVSTVLLLGLSLPFAFRERALAAQASGGSVYSPENRRRVADLVLMADFPPGTPLTELSTVASLHAGQSVLLEKCVRCHDLKTILERPRIPSDWVSTVSRMAEKPALFAPISEQDQWHVCAYLIAITPDLQRSAKSQKQAEQKHSQAMAAGSQAGLKTEPEVDAVAAQTTFQKLCSQCHATSEVDKSPPKTAADIPVLLQRMSRNGMRASPQEIRLLQFYLTKTYLKAPEEAPRRGP